MMTEIDDTKISDVMFVGTQLMTELKSFIKNEYVCISCNFEKSTVTGNSYRFEFKSNKAKRTISISYTPQTKESKMHCFIVNIESKNGERIYLDDLINEHNLFGDIDNFDLETYEGDTKQKIQKFVKFLDKVFSENFKGIISGKEWEDIGFDWQGYK